MGGPPSARATAPNSLTANRPPWRLRPGPEHWSRLVGLTNLVLLCACMAVSNVHLISLIHLAPSQAPLASPAPPPPLTSGSARAPEWLDLAIPAVLLVGSTQLAMLFFREGASTRTLNLLVAGMATLAMSADAVRQAADLGTLSPLVPCIPLFLAGLARLYALWAEESALMARIAYALGVASIGAAMQGLAIALGVACNEDLGAADGLVPDAAVALAAVSIAAVAFLALFGDPQELLTDELPGFVANHPVSTMMTPIGTFLLCYLLPGFFQKMLGPSSL